jgi:hypothetical protein
MWVNIKIKGQNQKGRVMSDDLNKTRVISKTIDAWAFRSDLPGLWDQLKAWWTRKPRKLIKMQFTASAFVKGGQVDIDICDVDTKNEQHLEWKS